MDNKLILIQAITLLTRESQLEDGGVDSSAIIRPIAESIQLPDISIGLVDSEREILIGLKKICIDMCDAPVKTFEILDILQKVQYLCRNEESLYKTLHSGISTDLEQNKLKKVCSSIRRSLKKHEDEKKITEILQKAATDVKFNRDKITDIHAFVAEMYTKLDPYRTGKDDNDPAIVGCVDFSDKESLEKEFELGKELNDDRGILKTGWQGVNRLTQGGLRRGESIVALGLQHNFKTGFTLSLFKHIALYNKPFMLDEKKKPMLLHISFENSLSLNMPFLYKNIYENKTLQQADIAGKTSEEMAMYVIEELKVNGYEIRFIHVNPSLWTYLDIQNYVISLEAEGYEIHLLMTDYLNMIPKTGCDNTGPQGSNIRDLFRRMRNFCAARKTTFVTPHQLSTEAKMLIRNGLEDTFVKEVANKGYYDSCRTIDQEVDLEIYFHIVKVDGKSYLTVQRGKHRLIHQTKPEYLYCVLPFEDIGDIRDDVNGPDTTRKKPGHGPMGSPDSVPFWDFGGEKSPV